MFDLKNLSAPQLHILRTVAVARIHADDCPGFTQSLVASIDAHLLARAGAAVDGSLTVEWSNELAAALRAAVALQTQLENLGETAIADAVNEHVVGELLSVAITTNDKAALHAFRLIVDKRHGPDTVQKVFLHVESRLNQNH